LIPITRVAFDEETEKLVLEVLRSGVVAQGPLVERFEEEFAQLVGVEHAVAVNNGTTALIAALSLLDLEPGDEVITSPFTFVATLNAILDTGATVRFADISDVDFTIAPHRVADVVTDRTKVVMPVHLYGQCADMVELSRIAEIHGLRIVEDAAQAHGARIGDRGAGSWGLGCFSFYATKNLTTGEGGMVTTSDASAADRLRVLRNQGMRRRYEYEMVGNNFRLTDLAAALVLPQLSRYEETVSKRRINAQRLTAGLTGVPGLVTPAVARDRTHVWHQYTVRLDGSAPVDRDEVVARLTELGIGCGVYYPRLVHDYACYRTHPRVVVDPTPVAQAVASSCLSLPVHQFLDPGDVNGIVDAVRQVLDA
jgi:dTDP-4-amino-4,6-dideoxygalactose transaminase